MRTLPLLILLIWLASPATSRAELRTIGVLVTKDSQSKTRISIYSDVQEENKTNVTVSDAIPVLRDAKGWGSSVKVGVLVRGVRLADYLPLLTEISKNSHLDMAFLEGEKPYFVHDNIRRRIVAAHGDEKLAAEGWPLRDPVLSSLPPALRKVFEETFPNYRCIRLASRGRDEAAVYRGTFFDPANGLSVTGELVSGEHVVTPPLYHLELDAVGKVLEETHPIDRKQLPKAVLAAYQKWNPKGVEGQEHYWQTEVARGQARVYRVAIIVNAVMGYRATFREDGTVVEADPAIIR